MKSKFKNRLIAVQFDVKNAISFLLLTLVFNTVTAQTTEIHSGETMSPEVVKQKSTNTTSTKEFKFSKSHFVVITNKAEWNLFKDASPAELTQAELNEIEEILKLTIADHNQKQKNFIADFNIQNPDKQMEKTGMELKYDGFLRQYVPVLSAQGEKVIWLNFLIDNFTVENWQTERAEVDGGGNLYFNFKINLTKKQVYDLKINVGSQPTFIKK